MHPNNKLLFEKFAIPCLPKRAVVLEIGPDGFPSTYERLLAGSSERWDTLDIREDSRLTYSCSDPYTFPIPDDSYDVVVAGNVLEHVPRVWVWIRELARVCKPGGLVITINPVSWPYHAAPVDCWRVYPDGMRALYAEAGLDVLLSSVESVEKSWYRRSHASLSFPEYLKNRPWPVRILYRLAVGLGYPAMAAHDTVTIGLKRHQHKLED